MELSDFYPSPSDLIKCELDVLDHLRTDPYIKETHSQFAQHASKYYERNRGGQSRGFEFVSYFDLWHAAMDRSKREHSKQESQTSNVRLILAARIELDRQAFSNVSYCLTVCRIRSARIIILRKFHFDVTISEDNSGRRRQQHPQCHLQYCGEMVPEMEKMGCRTTQLEKMNPWLSEPRIFSSPMSLALLIDMALHEFPDERSRKFRKSNEWRGLVRRQENLVLRPFYKKCVEVIVDTKKNNRTLAEEFYVG
jgi:hypothetical protein